MALLAFEDTRSSPVADLMDISQRQKTASELNAAILSSQCQVSAVPCCLLLRACLQISPHTVNRKLCGHHSSLGTNAHSMMHWRPFASTTPRGAMHWTFHLCPLNRDEC